jgi:glyoxylase-like metal-dependent hydrolase (beta-lactamase superfamily II)
VKQEPYGIVIDPGDEPEKIKRAIGELHILLILATHRHFDHVTAFNEIKRATGAQAAIHPLDWIPDFDLKLEDNQQIEFTTARIKIIHTPGHTPGGCCFLMDTILFSGDTLFQGGHGNTMFPGGDEQAIYKSIREKLLVLPDATKVYPGHGPPTTIGQERVLY